MTGRRAMHAVMTTAGRRARWCSGLAQGVRHGFRGAATIAWMKTPVAGSMLTHPEVYCLRGSETTWGAETLWHTYTMLIDRESVFRGLKWELGLRPVFHHTEDRTEGHLFITVLAYQLVQAIRRKLEAAGTPCPGPGCARPSRCSNGSPRHSSSATVAPCMFARPPSPNPPCAGFTRRWRSMRGREGSRNSRFKSRVTRVSWHFRPRRRRNRLTMPGLFWWVLKMG